MEWIEVLYWDEESQSFFPRMELVPKTEEELRNDDNCTWFWATIGAIIGVVAIVSVVAIAL